MEETAFGITRLDIDDRELVVEGFALDVGTEVVEAGDRRRLLIAEQGVKEIADQLHLNNGVAVARYRRIMSHQPHRLDEGLRHEQAVERVLVMCGQCFNCRRMLGLDG